MAKTVDLKAVNVQLEADKAGLEASARKKNNALGNISCMWLEVPPTSGIVEEPAAVYAAWLAQLPFRLAKKGSETVPFAPLHLWLINLLMQPVSNLSLERLKDYSWFGASFSRSADAAVQGSDFDESNYAVDLLTLLCKCLILMKRILQ
ncbi:MAG: hypothetical protein FRX49_00593 [Trebouxia sp. A1-2]|nr:MAG: hypothetical protein FRX49_00593 [Trebouxia sp. A1-2]